MSFIGKFVNATNAHSFRHWNLRYFYNRLKLFLYELMHPEHPWLTQQANEILLSCLRKTDVGLEWGSGRSTIWFAQRVSNLTSVEHDPIWYEKVKEDLLKNNLTNTKLYCYESSLKEKSPKNIPYVNVVDNFPDDSLDFALVDGLFRDECTFRVLKKLKPGGLLIVDNINWYLPSNSSAPSSRTEQTGPISQSWHQLTELLKDYRCIWTSNGVFDTAIWIKPCSK